MGLNGWGAVQTQKKKTSAGIEEGFFVGTLIRLASVGNHKGPPWLFLRY